MNQSMKSRWLLARSKNQESWFSIWIHKGYLFRLPKYYFVSFGNRRRPLLLFFPHGQGHSCQTPGRIYCPTMIQTLYVDTDNIEHVLTLLMIGLVHHRSPNRAFYELCSVGGSRLMSAFGGDGPWGWVGGGVTAFKILFRLDSGLSLQKDLCWICFPASYLWLVSNAGALVVVIV